MGDRIEAPVSVNLLVIEDNNGDFFLIEEYLEEMFYDPKIVHVRSYAEAQELLSDKNHAFDTILLDATLPDNQGLTLVSDILQLANQTPIIILTGYESLDFSISTLSLGVSEYLLKDEINPSLLHKSIVFSIERKKNSLRIEESEKRYSELFHMSPLPMWVYDALSYQIIQVNLAAINHYGFSESEFLNMSILELIPEDDIDSRVDFQSYHSQNQGLIINHILKNGRRIKTRLEQNPVTIDGRACRILHSNDITLLMDAQESLRNAYVNIIEIEEKEKERFAAELHDGLQQNIVAAKLMFSYLEKQLPTLAEEPRAILLHKTLQGALEECTEIIREVRPKGLFEQDFCTELKALVEKVKATGDVEVILESQLDLVTYYNHFDLMHIYRIIQELFNNAIKYAQPTRIELEFKINNNSIELSFTDNGNGISKELLEAKSSFISIKRRVQILNAKLEVCSTINEGSRFLIRLPINHQ